MKLEIKAVRDRGTEKERVVLEAKEDCDIGMFFLFTTKRVEKSISTQIRDPFWLVDKKVKRGDLVVIYSKSGTSSFKNNKDGSTSYFYYRKSTEPLLNTPNSALLVEAANWMPESTQT